MTCPRTNRLEYCRVDNVHKSQEGALSRVDLKWKVFGVEGRTACTSQARVHFDVNLALRWRSVNYR